MEAADDKPFVAQVETDSDPPVFVVAFRRAMADLIQLYGYNVTEGPIFSLAGSPYKRTRRCDEVFYDDRGSRWNANVHTAVNDLLDQLQLSLELNNAKSVEQNTVRLVLNYSPIEEEWKVTMEVRIEDHSMDPISDNSTIQWVRDLRKKKPDGTYMDFSTVANAQLPRIRLDRIKRLQEMRRHFDQEISFLEGHTNQ